MPEDTPPAGAPTPIPTVGTVSRQLQGVASQIHGTRNDIDGIVERLRLVQQGLVELRGASAQPPAAASSSQPPERPSMAVKAAQKGLTVGKAILIAIGALGVAAQVAAVLRPGLVGPLQTAIQLLQLLQGHP